jgi:tRNA pseudouridine38-40 synthase
MARYFIQMAFDGSAYHGWQVQPNALTIQQIMEEALSTLLREKIKVTGAGRTDTGVHASFFMAHFDVSGSKIPGDLAYKLNRFLPEDILIHRIFKVDDAFHARFSATYRTYHYVMTIEKPLFDRMYTHVVHGELDRDAIRSSCQALFDYRDFTSFSKLHTDVENNHCHIMQAEWIRTDRGYRFEIKANRFLRNMVRSIVGTLLLVGHGKTDPEGFRKIIESKDRSLAGMSVPAKALFLVDIGYPEDQMQEYKSAAT